MNNSNNFKLASFQGFCGNTDGFICAAPILNRGFFIAKLDVQLVPIHPYLNGRLRDYVPKVKHLTEFIRTTSDVQIKEPYKRHLFKPYSFDGIGGFCPIPKGASWAVWLHDTRRFIKRWCFLFSMTS